MNDREEAAGSIWRYAGRAALVLLSVRPCLSRETPVIQRPAPAQTAKKPAIGKAPTQDNLTLRQLADQIGFKIGAAIAPPVFGEPGHQEVLGREFNSAESVMQFRMVQPQEGRFNFNQVDLEMAYARDHHMTLFGGPLIYKRQSLPSWMDKWFWFESSLDDVTRTHIQTVMRHGGSIFSAWEVVNEPLTTENWPWGHVWSREEYIVRAFRYAREASATAVLVMNQSFGRSGVERDLTDQFFNMLREVRAKGAPVDAAGIEMHIEMQTLRPTYLDEFKDFLSRAEQAGVLVYVTEMDAYQGPPGTVAQPFERQRQIYHDVLAACLASPACKAYYTWGLTDRLNMYQHRLRDPHPDAKPLPFDENYQKKPAYYGMLAALEERVDKVNATARKKAH
jgi:endo-1,4-beta-xylanase